MKLGTLLVGMSVASLSTGCASWGKQLKSLFAEPKPAVAAPSQDPSEPQAASAFDRDEMGQIPQRQYGRMSRARMEHEAQLTPHAGSLWRTEGQGAYLFSENNFRLKGDLLNVKLDGAPKEQLEAKAKVIADLLKKLDKPRGPASAAKSGGQQTAAAAPAEGGDSKAADGAAGPAPEESAAVEFKQLPVEVVPTRVLERLADGNYRVEGSQAFMIGKREYRVLVAGIVRAQDFNDESVPAPRLMEPKFDIVATKKQASGVFK